MTIANQSAIQKIADVSLLDQNHTHIVLVVGYVP
jgi:hypothetical protein